MRLLHVGVLKLSWVLGLSPEPWLVDPSASLLAPIHAAALLAMLCLLHYSPTPTVADSDAGGHADAGADGTAGATATAYTSHTRARIADGSCTAPLLADSGVPPLQAPPRASGSGLGYSPPLPPEATSTLLSRPAPFSAAKSSLESASLHEQQELDHRASAAWDICRLVRKLGRVAVRERSGPYMYIYLDNRPSLQPSTELGAKKCNEKHSR